MLRPAPFGAAMLTTLLHAASAHQTSSGPSRSQPAPTRQAEPTLEEPAPLQWPPRFEVPPPLPEPHLLLLPSPPLPPLLPPLPPATLLRPPSSSPPLSSSPSLSSPRPPSSPLSDPGPLLTPPPHPAPLRAPAPLRLAPPLGLPPPLQWPAPEAPAAPEEEPGEPQPGQKGKDVIWLPTPEHLVDRMLAMSQVGPRDVLYDLGSGDGRLVIAAAKRGARAVGVELDSGLVALSERRAHEQGVATQTRFVEGDIFETDFSEATVVTLYLLSTLNMRLRPTLLGMRSGTRVVSHAFDMDDWTPDEVSRAQARTAYLWIVPAVVQGSWRVELSSGASFDLALTQQFQRIEGTIDLGAVEAGLREPALRADAIRFGFVDQDAAWYELTGTVSGDRISGTYRAAGENGTWTAVRR